MTLRHRTPLLRVASVLALVALGFIAWSVVDPRPLPVIVAMSVGQGLGTLSFVAYLVVVATDLRRGRRQSVGASFAASDPPPSMPPSEPPSVLKHRALTRPV
jgi:hypothetical protein